MKIEEHLVVLSVLAAGGAVARERLQFEHGDDAYAWALWSGPLYERWVFPTGGRPFVEIYYAGAEACRERISEGELAGKVSM